MVHLIPFIIQIFFLQVLLQIMIFFYEVKCFLEIKSVFQYGTRLIPILLIGQYHQKKWAFTQKCLNGHHLWVSKAVGSTQYVHGFGAE